MNSHLWRVPVLALVVLLASCSGKGGDEPQDADGAPDSTGMSAPESARVSDDWRDRWREKAFAGKDTGKLWEQFAQAAQAELSKPGADPSDLSGKASTLGSDPQKTFEFIRDQITFEPYAGVLRGARGTLAAGAGNALDRALLAQELLRLQDRESRLVMGKLSDAQADELLTGFLATSAVPKLLADLVKAPDEAARKAGVAELSGRIGLSESSANELMQHADEQGRQFHARTDGIRATQFDLLDSQLRKGKVKTEVDGAALLAKLKDRVRKHYWLQVREPDGSWSEFDPSFSGAERGTAYGSEPVSLSGIPEEEFHRLEFRLVYQTMTDGAPAEQVLIADTIAAADALFEPMEFRIQPANVAIDADAMAMMDDKQQIAMLRNIKKFQGVLRKGDTVTASRFFDLAGNTYDDGSPLLPVTGGTFADAFGGGGESTPLFLELRVVMRLIGPDREPMSQVRTMVRSRDTQAPTFAPPILEWELFLQPQWLSAEFVGFRALDQTVATGNALLKATRASQSGTSFESPPSVSLLLLQMALLRQGATADILASQNGIRAFVDEPLLTISGQRLTGIDDQEGLIKRERTIDIVENAIRYVARDGAPASAAFNAALRQSAADSTIEGGFLRVAYPDADTRSGTTVFDRARAETRPMLLAKTQDIDKLRETGVSEANIEWIYDNEPPSARLLVATTADGSNAWWSIRPDGNSILRSDGGQGLSLAEYKLLNAKVAMGVLCLFETAVIQHRNQESGDPDAWRRALVFCMITSSVAGVSFIGGLYAHGWHAFSYALMGVEYVLALRGISGAH